MSPLIENAFQIEQIDVEISPKSFLSGTSRGTPSGKPYAFSKEGVVSVIVRPRKEPFVNALGLPYLKYVTSNMFFRPRIAWESSIECVSPMSSDG